MKNGLIEDKNGDKGWYVDGKLHRVDGPACELADGSKAWFINGGLHRVDGPAVIMANGYKEWWMNGIQYTSEKEYAKAVEQYKKIN